MKQKTKEQDTVRAILDYLTYRNIGHAHIRNTGSMFFNKKMGKVQFSPRGIVRGVPDILGCYRGRGLAIEVKSSIGKTSPEQDLWLGKWANYPTSGLWLVARSVDDVEKFLKEYDETHPEKELAF